VADELALGQAEVAEHAGNQPAVMIAGQEKRGCAGGIEFQNGRNLLGAET
jgi:hypothetical protein